MIATTPPRSRPCECGWTAVLRQSLLDVQHDRTVRVYVCGRCQRLIWDDE